MGHRGHVANQSIRYTALLVDGSSTPVFNSVELAGFSSARFGVPNAFNLRQDVTLSGFTSARFGVPDAYNLNRIIYLQGVSSPQFGVPGVSSNYIDIPGVSSARFGVPTAYNVIQEVQLFGISAARFGLPSISSNYINLQGISSARFGTLNVSSSYVNIPGISSARFGDLWVSHGDRDIYQYHALAYDGHEWVIPPMGNVGIPTALHTQVALQGFSSARIGNLRASPGEQVIYLRSTYNRLIGPGTMVIPQHRDVLLEGFSSARFGNLSTDPGYVYLQGIPPREWPTPGMNAEDWKTTATHSEIHGVSVGQSARVGTPWISYSPIVVSLSGLDNARMGSPSAMHQFDQDVLLEGFSSARFGMEDWDWDEGSGRIELTDYAYFAGASFGRVGQCSAEHVQ